MKTIPMLGKSFGRWTVISLVGVKKGQKKYLCRCKCGVEKVVVGYTLRHGTSRSCGCLIVEAAKQRGGKNSPCWKGGKWKSKDGYVHIRVGVGKSPQPSKMEHRLVMEKFLGRELFSDETVHHKNGVRSDNRIENLELKVGSHGEGLSISDALAWAKDILFRYTTNL